MRTSFCRRTVWLPCLLVMISGLLICSGCGDKQQTASAPGGGPGGPKAPPGMPPAPPAFNQPGGAPTAGMPSGGTNVSYPASQTGAPGTLAAPGTVPAPGGGTAPAANGQANAGAPNNNAPGTDAAPATEAVPSGPPVAGFEVGNIAPEIDGEDLEGESFRLSDYRGKVIVLDFWGDW